MLELQASTVAAWLAKSRARPPRTRGAPPRATQLRRGRPKPKEPKDLRIASPFSLNEQYTPFASVGAIASLATYESVARFVTPVTDHRCPGHGTPIRTAGRPPRGPSRQPGGSVRAGSRGGFGRARLDPDIQARRVTVREEGPRAA